MKTPTTGYFYNVILQRYENVREDDVKFVPNAVRRGELGTREEYYIKKILILMYKEKAQRVISVLHLF